MNCSFNYLWHDWSTSAESGLLNLAGLTWKRERMKGISRLFTLSQNDTWSRILLRKDKNEQKELKWERRKMKKKREEWKERVRESKREIERDEKRKDRKDCSISCPNMAVTSSKAIRRIFPQEPKKLASKGFEGLKFDERLLTSLRQQLTLLLQQLLSVVHIYCRRTTWWKWKKIKSLPWNRGVVVTQAVGHLLCWMYTLQVCLSVATLVIIVAVGPLGRSPKDQRYNQTCTINSNLNSPAA